MLQKVTQSSLNSLLVLPKIQDLADKTLSYLHDNWFVVTNLFDFISSQLLHSISDSLTTYDLTTARRKLISIVTTQPTDAFACMQDAAFHTLIKVSSYFNFRIAASAIILQTVMDNSRITPTLPKIFRDWLQDNVQSIPTVMTQFGELPQIYIANEEDCANLCKQFSENEDLLLSFFRRLSHKTFDLELATTTSMRTMQRALCNEKSLIDAISVLRVYLSLNGISLYEVGKNDECYI